MNANSRKYPTFFCISVSSSEKWSCWHPSTRGNREVDRLGRFSTSPEERLHQPLSLSHLLALPRTLQIETHPRLPLPVRSPVSCLSLPGTHLASPAPCGWTHLGLNHIPVRLWVCHSRPLGVHFSTSSWEGKFKGMRNSRESSS